MRSQTPTSRLRRSPRKCHGNLGDTDTITEDDELNTFRTPSQLDELTDYELNLSASPGPPRRSSTIRKQISSSARSRTRQEDEFSNEETSDNSETLIQSSKSTLAPSSKTGSSRAATTLSSKQKSVNRRKQLTPAKRQDRFLKEVRKLQNRTDFLIPRLPFSRLIREIIRETSDDIHLITKTALEALQTSAEVYLEQRLHDAYLLTLHRGRVTLDVRDMILINFLRQSAN